MRVFVAEEGMSQKSRTSDSGTAEHKRLVKNMETQLQVSYFLLAIVAFSL